VKLEMKIGDRIKFRSPTRSGNSAAWRKVKGFDSFGRPLVGFHGWDRFVVLPSEVLEIEPAN
jgi:hypothetical protein